ncbi:Hsp70 family protein [Rhodococcoides yunnanense]|uniref:Hsp70 family protein n=1 Tax=Rhodococcoides yunnanense TaxID=278209 RepID=UPI000934B58A|nr:Hsp70 family protein [Rhodococcus yunnanensis]
MTEVLGVSVGSSAVRMARPDLRLHTSGEQELDFRSDTVDAYWDRAEELAAESIGVVLAQNGGNQVEATGVAYRDQQQFGEIQQAMARQRLYNYRLVPEARATLAYLEASGEIGDFGTICLYDLGSSGLTISVLDRRTGEVLLAERTTDISGDDFDRLICDNQLAKQGMELQNTLGVQEFTSRCRIAKEQLSTSGAVCLPGDSGVILISRESFEALVTVPIEYSARLVRDIVARSPQYVDAVFLVGGGARIPLVEAILRSWTGLHVVTPRDPEAVAAKGAALLATPVETPALPPPPATPLPAMPLSGAPDWLSPEPVDRPGTSKRKIRGAALVAVGLGAIAALGLTLGYGGSEEPASAPADTVSTSTATVPTTTRPAPTTTVAPAPPATTEAPAPAAPVETYEAPRYEEPAPAPAPAPAPPPLIPGLPQIQLPQIQLPPPPVFELPRF